MQMQRVRLQLLPDAVCPEAAENVAENAVAVVQRGKLLCMQMRHCCSSVLVLLQLLMRQILRVLLTCAGAIAPALNALRANI